MALFCLLLSAVSVYPPPGECGQKEPEVPRLLREIRDEVVGLGKYPGEEFSRGEFFLGEGDDDTNKTHAVGILVKEDADGSRMTIRGAGESEPTADNGTAEGRALNRRVVIIEL